MNPRLALAALCVLVSVPSAAKAQGFAHNKIEFHNWWVEDREDLFPNYLTAGGNLDGDGLFKVFPAELLERETPNRLSGYSIAVSVDDAYTGAFPLLFSIPGMQLHRTKPVTVAGQTYDTLDPAVKVGPRFDPVQILIPSDGTWVLDVLFDPNSFDPKLASLLNVPARVNGAPAGLAMLVLAPPGERRIANQPGTVLQSSFQERHVNPGRPSYSGSYAVTGGVTRMFGTTGMPSAAGELFVGLRFQTPTLQIYGSQAGGLDNDPFETHLGPGAYATDLATTTKSAWFGLFVQGEQYQPSGAAPTHRVYPFVVANSLAGPSAALDVFGVKMRVAPSELTGAEVLLTAGYFGGFGRYLAQGSAGWDRDQVGVWNSGRIPVPASPNLFGVNVWIQGLVATVNLVPVETTNAVRFTMR